MEFEMLKEAVEAQPRGEYVAIFQEWLESDNKTLVLKPKNSTEKRSVYQCAYQFRKSRNLDFTIYTERRTGWVYLVRA